MPTLVDQLTAIVQRVAQEVVTMRSVSAGKVTGTGITDIVFLSQAEYDALPDRSPSTAYITPEDE